MAINIHTTKEVLEEKPAVVLFDLDNTFYDYSLAHQSALKATAEKAGTLLGISEKDFHAAYNQARAEVKEQVGKTAASHSRLLYFQRLIEITGLKTQILLTLDLEQCYWRTFLASAVVFDGVKDLIEEFKLCDIPLGIVTDLTTQIQLRKIVYFQLADYFDCVVTSEEVGQEKPEKAVFQRALDKLKISGGPIWMIGDDYAKDIEGAKRACKAVTFQKRHKGTREQPTGEASDVVFSEFGEVLKIVHQLPWGE